MFIRPRSRSPAPPANPQGPGLGHTPSLKYQPITREDRKTDEHLQEMVRYRERTGAPHPDLPVRPAGVREMTAEEAAATRLFRERYILAERDANMSCTRGDFDRHEYCQTYRREGDEIVANQDEFIVGGFNYVTPQSGRFPPGTRVDIHSHPNVPHPSNAMPSDLDQRVAHQLRTNALHRPGTKMSGAIMYYPPTGKFFGYSGELAGFRKRPEYHELVDNFPDTQGPPDFARSRLRIPVAPPSRFIAYNPLYHRHAEAPAAATPQPAAPTLPIPIPGAQPRPTSLSGSPSRFASPQGSPSSSSSFSPRLFPSEYRGPYTPPTNWPLRSDPAGENPPWQRRAASADSRVPISDPPPASSGPGRLLQPKPRRAADIKAMPPLPQWEAITGAIEELSLDDKRGRPGFGEPPGSIVRRNRVTQRSQDGSRGPRQTGNTPATPPAAMDSDAPASLHPDRSRPVPKSWNDPDGKP